MTEYSFYQLLYTPLEQALPRLLEKIRSAGFRAVVLTGSEARTEALDTALWTYDPGSFLAHGRRGDPMPEHQPIWITDREENPNQASVLVITDGVAAAAPEAYERLIEIFDGRDDAATHEARERYRVRLRSGATLKFYRQSEQGWQLSGQHPQPD